MASILSKLSNLKPKRAFTLIELLVVMGVLSLLASAIVLSTDNARDKGKDAKRKQDLNALSTSLIAFYADNGHFPPLDKNSSVLDYSSDNTADASWIPDLISYIQKIPKDPLQGSIVTQVASAVTNSTKNITNQIASTFKNKNEPKPQVAAIQTKTYSITTGNDDVQGGHGSGFAFTKNGTSIEVSKYSTNNIYNKPGLRFSTVDLPSTTNIVAARLKFTPKNDTAAERSLNSSTGVHVSITTDITHTPSGQINDYNDFFARWDHGGQPPSQWKDIQNIPVWYSASGPVPEANTTFDVTDLVKGEINRSAWQTNYPLHFFLMPDDNAGYDPNRGRVFYSFEGNSSQTAKLEIDYDTTPTQGLQVLACEAESGTKLAGTGTPPNNNFANISDGAATGGVYLKATNDDNVSGAENVGPAGGNAGNGTGGSSTITVYPTSGGTYYIWARVNYPNTPGSIGENNSFWMQVNNKGPDGTPNTFFRVGNDNTSGWHWVNFRNGNTSDTIAVTLNAGSANTIKIWSREGDTQIDKIELVNQSYFAVSGNGETINCPTSAPTKTANVFANSTTGNITVPSGTDVRITWQSTNTASCNITSNPTGFNASGTNNSTGVLTGPITGPTTITYTLTCDPSSSPISDSVTVTVSPPGGGSAKTATIKANGATENITVPNNSNVTISWETTGITSPATCSLTGTFSSAPGNALNGSQASGNLTGPTTIKYTVSCDSGAASDDIDVIVEAAAGGGTTGGGGTRTACASTTNYCYRVSQDRKSFIIWARLENTKDPDIYNDSQNTAACNNDDPNVVPPNSNLNYCVKSPTLNIN